MEFRVLGPIEVVADRATVSISRGHRRTALAVLLAAVGHPVTTDRLVEALWGDEVPGTARKSLQSHVSRLRTDLQQAGGETTEAVLPAPDGYRIDLEHHTLDAVEFTTEVADARAMTGDPAAVSARLEAALARWRGPAFGELATHPAIRAEAGRLEQLRAAAQSDLLDARLRLGQHDDVIAELEAGLDDYLLDERRHGLLMLALYRSGRQADALATYRALQTRLRDELGIDPSPPLRALHERILRHAPDLASSSPPPTAAPAPSGPVGHRWASKPDRLFGRSEVVREVAMRLQPGMLVTLTGPGGVGKTSIAKQVVPEVADRFGDGVVLGALATVRDQENVGAALLTAMGIQRFGERSAIDALIDALGDRQLLLILDNCEHVLAAIVPIVEQILERCQHVGILATSRERLRVGGEQLWQVDPLEVPPRDAGPDDVAATPAGALFRTRAHAIDPSFALDATNAAAVGELCRRLDGMPLGIELAAARVRAMSPEDLVDRLGQRFSLLAGGPGQDAGRHRTLQAVVAWSYDLLGPSEAAVFDRLSVFAGSFALEDVERICSGGGIPADEVAGLLGELVDKSMVVVERRGTTRRYRLLDTLREFGARRLTDTDDPDHWRRRHAEHHVRLVERLAPEIRGAGEATAVAQVDASFDDLRAAHTWLCDAGDVDGALRLAGALGDYAFYRLRDEVTTWARRAVSLPGAIDQPAYAAALSTAAYGATTRDDCPRAADEASEALRHAASQQMATLWALGVLGTVALYEGNLDEVLDHAHQLVRTARPLGEPFYVAFAGVLRVIGHTYAGQSDRALEALVELERAAEKSRNPTMRAFARYCRGEAHLELNADVAIAALEQAVELARHVENMLVEGVSLVSLASLRGRTGDRQQALREYRDIVAHWLRLGDHTHQLTTLRNLVPLLTEVGADEPAAVLHGAVTAAMTPTFGLEAQRLARAWETLQSRLGADAAEAHAERGRALSPTELGTTALAYLDGLVAG